MQLNRREAGAHLRRPKPTESELFGMLDNWARHGVRCGIVTDGADAILARIGSERFRLFPPEIQPIRNGLPEVFLDRC